MLFVQVMKDSSRSVKIWWICNRKFDKRKILWNTGFVERPRYVLIMRSWMVTILLDFSVTQVKSQSDFSIDFAAVLTVVPVFYVATLVFPICHGINLFKSCNLHNSSC